MSKGKLPAIQFYPGDWLRDNVAGLSLAAQGLWLRMMILGHDSERYGYLLLNGSAMPPSFVARKCGSTLAEYEALLDELDAAGVPSRTPEGVIFSRRMVRDANSRSKSAARVKRFRNVASNALSNAACNGVSNDVDNGEVTPLKHASSSSISSSISSSPPSAPPGGRRERGRAKGEEQRQAALAAFDAVVAKGGTP